MLGLITLLGLRLSRICLYEMRSCLAQFAVHTAGILQGVPNVDAA